MSCAHMMWAMEVGRERGLVPSDRLVLLALADRANAIGLCWPSQTKLAADTGLAERTCFGAVHRLADAGLVRLELRGRSMHYFVLMPAKEANPTQPAQDKHYEPPQPVQGSNSHGNGKHYEPPQPVPDKHYRTQQPLPHNGTGTPQPVQRERRKWTPRNAAMVAAKPTKIEPTNEPRARAGARSEGRINSHSMKGRAAPPAPEREPTVAEIEERRAASAAAIEALPPSIGAAISSLGAALHGIAWPTARLPSLTRDEQIDLLRPRPKALCLPDAVLRTMPHRQQAMARAGTP